MPYIALMKNNSFTESEDVYLNNRAEIKDYILKHNYYPGPLDGNPRRKEHFNELAYLCLDIDEGLSIDEAIKRAKKTDLYTIIATTRNHKKKKVSKGGIISEPKDRFRIIVKVGGKGANTYLASLDEYKPTVQQILEIYPEADKSALEPMRMFFKSVDIVYEGGTDALNIISPKNSKVLYPSNNALEPDDKGELSFITQRFLSNGAPKGQWHWEFLKATTDLKSQNYKIEEARNTLRAVTGYLDSYDLYQVISVYNREGNEFPFRKKENRNG